MTGSFVALIDSSPLFVRVGTPVISVESVNGCKKTAIFENHTDYIASSGKVVKLLKLLCLDVILGLKTTQVHQSLDSVPVLNNIEECELGARNSRGV